MRGFFTGLALLLCTLLPNPASGEAPDPLRLVPREADAVIKIENPRALFDAVYGHEIFQEFLKTDAVAASYDTTKFRRLMQLIAYFEKELGHERLDLLDRLTGAGAVVAARLQHKEVLLVLQAKDDKVLEALVARARKLIDQEIARQDSKEQLRGQVYRNFETLSLGKDLHVARAGSALLVSNKESVLHKALDLHVAGGKNSVADGPKLTEIKSHLPNGPLVWAVLNLEQVKGIQGVKAALEALGVERTLFTVGSVIDVIKRSPYVCAGLVHEGGNLHIRVAMPKGRDGMAPLAAVFLPEDQQASLPMLKPPRVLSCTSYYLDPRRFWDNRHTLLTAAQAKEIDKVEAQTGKFLKGVNLGAIFQQLGKYQRVVITTADKAPYSIKPTITTGSFALILNTRDPGFATTMGKVLRGAALVAGFKFGLKMVEEKHSGHVLTTYYFPEKGKLEGDINDIRFNFSPCFTQVGDQFVISSTLELGKDLVDCLRKETRAHISPAAQRTHVYGTGLAANIRASEDLLLSQAILSRALPADDAKKEFENLVRLVERLGQVNFETRYAPDEFRLDIEWQFANKFRTR